MLKKNYGKHPIWGYKSTLKKEKCILSVFKPLPYKNGETHTKEPLRTNRILPKPEILIVFQLLPYKNSKMYAKVLCIRKRKDIIRHVYNECF